MAENDKPRSPFGDISKDNPRTLERVSDGARTRVTDPLEFMSLTTAHGYRDITESGSGSSRSGSSRKGGSSNAGTGSGTTEATGSTGAK